MGYNKVYHPVVGVIKRSTDKAILLVVTDPEALTEDEATIENWIPRSQIAKMTPLQAATPIVEVMLSEWIIGQKSLTSFISKAKSPVPSAPSIGNMDDDIPY